MNVLLFEPPTQTSNEHEVWGRMPGAHVTVISDRDGWDGDASLVFPSRRVPILGSRGWGAGLAWLRGLAKAEFSPVPDVVVSLELFTPITAQAARVARRLGVPHVLHIAENMARNPLYRVPPWSLITRAAGHRADGYICMSESARQHLIERGIADAKCRVVYMGIDTEFFHPSSAGLAAEPRACFVGVLREDPGVDKGITDLCDAFSKLDRADAELHLFGDGPLRSELIQRAAQDPRIRVRGRVPRAQLAEELRSMRVLVLPSRRTWKSEEQFGYVLVEAMATGLPVIGTRVGAIPEVVPPENPLVEEGDPDSLAVALELAFGPEATAWGLLNRQVAVERFDRERQAVVLESAVRELVGL